MRDHEEVLEPELEICDAHHHLWSRPGQTYLIDDFLGDLALGGHCVTSTVLVESGSFTTMATGATAAAIAEVRMGAHAAKRANLETGGRVRACIAIVGHADLRSGAALKPTLERLQSAAQGRLRAIRHCGTWDASEVVRGGPALAPASLYMDPAFIAGARLLARVGLAFDAWAFQTQHEDVLHLAKAVPDLRIVYNHVGGVLGTGPYAGRRDALYAKWLAGMTELARTPNLFLKLGGLGMQRSGFPFYLRKARPTGVELATAWRPWIETAITLFGPDRCMFESNFPVDKASCDYRTLWNGLKILARHASQCEKRALFHDTAMKFYVSDPD